MISDQRAAAEQRLADFVARMTNVGSQAQLDASAADVLAAFEAAGVDALLLKGPALAQRLYRAEEHRSYVDIDVLVDPRRLEPARDALIGLGYDREGTERAGVDDFLGVLHGEAWAGPSGCGLDLHWRLPGCDLAPAEAWALLYPDRTTITVDGKPASALADAALTLHVATNAAQSGPDDPKAMGDLARALERWPIARWRAAASLAGRLAATEAMAAGLRLRPDGAALADDLGLPASTGLRWAIAHRAARPRGTFHVRGLIEARGWRARAGILRRSLLPARAWIIAQRPRAGRGGLALVAAYALHLMQAPLWAARAWRFDRRARRAARTDDQRRR